MKADIGMIGLAVMGSNLALNMIEKGFTVAVYNLEPEAIDAFMKGEWAAQAIPCYDLETLVASLSKPRVVMMMIRAGSPVDQVISRLLPLLEPGDIIVDGGKGQVTSAVEALDQIGLQGQIAVVGIAKRLNEVFFPGDSVPLYIDKNSETLHVIQRLRDEAHRFAITFHRKQRSKGQVHSALDEVPGIGPKTRTLLLKHFKSLKRIKEASEEELASLIGPAKAHKLYNDLQATTPVQ